MKRIGLGLFVAALFAFAATAAQAQTCPPDPVTGFAVAQMISPTNGSTLPAGAVTFDWCNANADYFLQIETVPGAHDIFYAFTGGAGQGAGQNFLTLGPLCAAGPPIQCIPANGETIYVTLWTVKNKQILPPSPFQYTYKAASTVAPPAATTTSVGNASVFESAAAQSVTLTATVTGGTVNEGAVTFQVVDGAANNIGAAVTSATLTTGSASVTYVLPAGTVAGPYTIKAAYSGGTNFLASNGTGTLTVNLAPTAQAATTTTVDPQSTTFSSADQNVTLTATVADGGSTVNEGTVTFQVVDGASSNVGAAVTSATLTNGIASAIYALPGGTVAGPYTIQATYSGGTNFLASSGSATLTVSPPPPTTQTVTATTASNNAVTFSGADQNVTLTAAVSVPGGTVNEGTVTFQVMNGAVNVGSAVPSAPLTVGLASVSYALPAGLAAGNYMIQAAYSGGTNFLASSNTATLTVNKAPSTTTFTSTAPASLPINATYTPGATSTGDGTLTIGASGSCSITSGVVTITSDSGTCTVTATESEGANFLGSAATPQNIRATSLGQLTALSPAKVWIGLGNSDDDGLRVDLLAEVFLKVGTTETKVGQGQLDHQKGGSSGFNNAILYSIPLSLTGGPVYVPAGAQLEFKLSVRRTCLGNGHRSGTARLWYNGQPIDSGSNRDAGSRFGATIYLDSTTEFLRGGAALSSTAGSSRLFVDRFVKSSAACPFTPFGTWSLTLP